MKSRFLHGSLMLALAIFTAAPALAQHPGNSRFANGMRMPLAPIPEKGEPVAPFFEGWYANPDGTFTFSFGYFNMNTEEIIDLPIGPDNFIEPAEFDGVQPTHFPSQPRRDRGIFHVTVPASYADEEQRVVWTITANGVPLSVPARVGYEALQLDYSAKAMGSVPPQVRFAPDGPIGEHITGIWTEPRTATVGTPLMLTVWGDEVSVRSPVDVVNTDVFLVVTWVKHQGPAGEVTFGPRRIKIEGGHGRATTNVTFMEPGEYLLRAKVDNHKANDSSGGDQCCWTNMYVPVTVTGG